jgi:hypothetical protein
MITEFCAVKDGLAYCGSKGEIVHLVCDYIQIDPDRTLRYRVPGFQEESRVKFGGGWSEIEMQIQSVLIIWERLQSWFGFVVYERKIND